MTTITIAELLLASTNARPLDVVNAFNFYSKSGASIGNVAYKLFELKLEFSERHRTRLRNSLKRGFYSAALRDESAVVTEYYKAIRSFESFYGK